MSRAVMVELFVEPDETLAFILRGDRAKARLERLPLGTEAALAWTKQIRDRISQAEHLDLSAELQAPLQVLLRALEQDTEPDDMIYFVPHGPLHLVPFHVLTLGATAMIRRNSIAYAPSASVLASLHAREHPDATAPSAIVVGDTRGDLRYADAEAETVSRLLNVAPILGAQATRRRLIDALGAGSHLRALHLACHGSFDPENALASGILTAIADDADPSAAVLRAQDILEMNLAVDLVALSACDSGINERRPGDELVGLTRALLVAGATSVLASLWRVDDLSTSILMQSFYDGWLRGQLPKVEALRRAQCRVMDMTAGEIHATRANLAPTAHRDILTDTESVLDLSDPNARVFAAPRHWAAFTLVGGWR